MDKLFFNSSFYFDYLIADINHAKKQILIEMFIVEKGEVLNKIIEALQNASKRGVKIYFVIDGYGLNVSNKYLQLFPFINFRVFKPIWNQILFLNQRNHRKLILIDDSITYIGSLNFHDKTVYWRETGVRIERDNYILKKIFWQTWNRSKGASFLDKIESKTERIFFSFKKFLAQKFLVTDSTVNRFKVHGFLFKKIQKSKKRIWIQTPYFNPTPLIFNKLLKASKRNIDIKIIVPSSDKTDMGITKTLDRYYLEKLIKNGVEVYEYIPQMLHSKITLFDNDSIIGSSNWNHRSHLRDLEIDVIINNKERVKEIESQLLEDIKKSTKITLDHFKRLNWIQKIYFNLVFLIRRLS